MQNHEILENNRTCHGQFPGLAFTPPITLDTGELPHDWGDTEDKKMSTVLYD